MKRCFIDLETSGINIEENGIIQIGGIIDINTDVEEIFTFDCKLFDFQECTEEALKVNKYTASQIDSFNSPQIVLVKLLEILDKYVDKYNTKDKFSLVGYNCSQFDMPWLKKFFENCGHKYFGSYFWFPSLDVMYMAADHLEEKRHTLKNFKLTTVAEALGIEVNLDEAHDAMYDIELTRKIFYTTK